MKKFKPMTANGHVLMLALALDRKSNVCLHLPPQQIVRWGLPLHGFNHVFIDPQIRHQLGRHFTIAAQCINLNGAASAEYHFALVMKLVSLCMAAKVIMIIKQQNFYICTLLLLVIPGRSQPTHPSANHHQIIVFINCLISCRLLALPSERMRHFKRAGMAAPHARQSGWIGARGWRVHNPLTSNRWR